MSRIVDDIAFGITYAPPWAWQLVAALVGCILALR